MLWHDLKQAVHARKPSSVAIFEHFSKEERAKIPPQQCEKRVTSCCKNVEISKGEYIFCNTIIAKLLTDTIT